MKLLELKRFVNHKDKRPFVDNHNIKWSDPKNWLSYDQALKNAREQNLGISIVLGQINNEYSLAGIDLDTIQDMSKSIIDFNIERDIKSFKHIHNSLSGYGKHILCLVKNDLKLDKGNRSTIKSTLNINRIDEEGNKKVSEIEFYTSNRTFAIPIDLDVSIDNIIDSTKDFKIIYDKYIKKSKRSFNSNFDKKDNDESRTDYGLVAKMYKKGHSPSEIKEEFLKSDYANNKDDEHKKKLFEREDYLDRTISNVIDDLENENSNNNAKVDNILNLIKDNMIFIDERETCYIIMNNRNIVIDSKPFEEYIEFICYDNNISVGGPTIEKVKKLLCYKAKKENNIIKLDLRFSGNNNEIYYQLSNEKVVKMTPNKYEIIDNDIMRFKRYKNTKDQVEPQNSGKVQKITEIFDFINVVKEQRLMTLVYLISLFIPNIPKPIGAIRAKKSSGKTTSTKCMKDIIDPSSVPTTRLPNNDEMLSLLLEHSALVCFDNISKISNEQSDFLCRAYSGDSVMTREIYSKDEEKITSYKRAIILNGIDCPIINSDLVDRTILFEFAGINPENRKTEDELFSLWEEKKPHFLDMIFNVISNAIPIYNNNTKLEKLERFADWQTWGYAIAEALQSGFGNKFLEEVELNRKSQDTQVIDNDPLLQLIIQFMESKPMWEDRPSKLLDELKLMGSFPSFLNNMRDTTLSRKLNHQQDILKHIGINFEKRVGTGNYRYIKLTNTNYKETKSN